jgi:hypothetical protein
MGIFSTRDARRIGDVVRRVEGMPRTESGPKRERRPRGGGGTPIRIARFTGSRWKSDGTAAGANDPGAVYTGRMINPTTGGGDTDNPVQWRFINDPGLATLITTNEFVPLIPAPEFVKNLSGWKDSEEFGDKYWALLTPWAALGSP